MSTSHEICSFAWGMPSVMKLCICCLSWNEVCALFMMNTFQGCWLLCSNATQKSKLIKGAQECKPHQESTDNIQSNVFSNIQWRLRQNSPLISLCIWNYFLYTPFLKNGAKRKELNFADSVKFILIPLVVWERCVACDFIHWEAVGWEEPCSPTQNGLIFINLIMVFTVSSMNTWNSQDEFSDWTAVTSEKPHKMSHLPPWSWLSKLIFSPP